MDCVGKIQPFKVRVEEMINYECYERHSISQTRIEEICMNLFEICKIKKINEINTTTELYMINEMIKIVKVEVQFELCEKYYKKYCMSKVVLKELKKEIISDIFSMMQVQL